MQPLTQSQIMVSLQTDSNYVGRSRDKYVILRNKMDFVDILQSIKMGKGVKYLKFWVALDSLKTVWHVFDTFSIFQAKQFWEVQILTMMDDMYVSR